MEKIEIGIIPSGFVVYVDSSLVAEKGLDWLRYELIDKEWMRVGVCPTGYYPVRPHFDSDNVVYVRASSYREAVSAYFKRNKDDVF